MLSTYERLTNPIIQYYIEQVRQLYYQSDVNPYVVPKMTFNLRSEHHHLTFDYRCIFITLLNEGCKLDLSNYPNVLLDSINDKNLIAAYPEGYQVTVPLSCNSDTMKLLRAKFNVTPVLNELTDNIESIMNICKNLNESLLITIRDCNDYSESRLLTTYLKFLKKPFTMDLTPHFTDYEHDCEVLRVNTSVCYDNLDHIREDCIEEVLRQLVNEGRYLRAKELLSKYPLSNPFLLLDTPVAYSVLFRLSEDYPDLIHGKDSVFIHFINCDHDLEYCTQFDECWNNITEIKSIHNPRALRLLKDRGVILPTCNQILEQSIQYDWLGNVGKVSNVQLRFCRSMIPYSEPITEANVRGLIAQLNSCDDGVIVLLIKLHENKLIQLEDYRGIHEYIDFLVPA